MSEEFDYDITPQEIPVTVGGKKYVLREATGDAACRYRNALLKSTKLGPEGKPSHIDGMADVEPLLVSLCLYEKTDPERLVALHLVRSWPSRIQKALFAKVKEISELDERDTAETLEKQLAETQRKLAELKNGDAAKNSHDATTAGSV